MPFKLLPCQILSRIRFLVFNLHPQMEMAHSNPHYSSCTFKAPTLPRKALFHSPPQSFRTHHHQNQRRAHRNAIIWYHELWFFKDEYLFVFFFLSSSYFQVVHLVFILFCCFYVFKMIWMLLYSFQSVVFVQIVLEHLISILCRILDTLCCCF